MTVAFPSDLPNPSIRQHSLQMGSAVIRTAMDDGYVRIRRRFRTVPTRYSVMWTFSESEMAGFEGWYHSVLIDGQERFTVNLANGQGVTEVTAYFVDDWKAKLIGCDNWEITASLHAVDRPTILFIATESGDDLITESSNNLVTD